jgi:hypothetical protein
MFSWRIRQMAEVLCCATTVQCLLTVVCAFSTSTQQQAQQASSFSLGAIPRQQTILLVGEVHGTVEIPRLFSTLVKVAAAGRSKSIGVGLELPFTLQAIMDDAVHGHFSRDVLRERFTTAPEWQKINDGRTSEAMLDLICDIATTAAPSQVSLFFFDTQVSDRNQTMAEHIATRLRERGYDLTLILTGNVHANRARHYPGLPSIRPMGWDLAQKGFVVRSFDTRYSGGNAWACIEKTCGVHQLKAYKMKDERPTPPDEGFDDILFVGAINASLPVHAARREIGD